MVLIYIYTGQCTSMKVNLLIKGSLRHPSLIVRTFLDCLLCFLPGSDPLLHIGCQLIQDSGLLRLVPGSLENII